MHGLQKAVVRTSVALGQKLGTVDKTIDREYEEEARRLLSFENKCENMYKEAKSYLDAVRSATMTQQRISTSITTFYDETAILGLCGLKYKDAMDLIDGTVRQELDNTFRGTVLEPMQRFLTLFPDMHEATKKRNNKALDYDSQRTKVRKLVERPSNDPTKLPLEEQRLAEAKVAFETLNNQLKNDVPRLIDLRIPYYDPIFEAMVKAQLKFYSECLSGVEPLQIYFNEEQGTLQNAEMKLQEVIAQMRDLSIVRTSQLK